MRIFFYKFKRAWANCEKKKLFAVVLVLLSVYIGVVCFDLFLSPAVYSLAETSIKGKTAECINDGVGKIFQNVKFEDIYTVSRDDIGEITGIFLDSVEVNRLKSDIVSNICESIKKNDTSVEVPVGNIFGNVFIGGRGRKITVKIVSVGAVESELVNKIGDSGVNQTHLSSYINIKADITARIGRKNIEVHTVNEVLLCESVIVGRVPDSFVNVNVMDEETLKWLNSYK